MIMLCIFNVFNVFTEPTLKRKCCHFDEILITDCTESCHFDNFRCSQWLKFRQNDDISVSVYFNLLNAEVLLCLQWQPSPADTRLNNNVIITSKRRRDIMTLLLRCLWRYIKLESLNLNHSSLWNGFYSISMPDNENQKQSRSLWIHKLSSLIFRRNTKKPYRSTISWFWRCL